MWKIFSLSSISCSLLLPFGLILLLGDSQHGHHHQNGPAKPSMTATAIPFNAIVPNLSTGWFHKPGPAESIFFGLIVLKVLALRMAGVFPYKLNDLLEDGGYFDKFFDGFGSGWKGSVADNKVKRTARDVYFMKNSVMDMDTDSNPSLDIESLFNLSKKKSGKMSQKLAKKVVRPGYSKLPLLKEIDAVERILLGLRRIDSHDCFIRHVCQINQNHLSGVGSPFDEAILKVFTLKPKGSQSGSSGDKTSIWDIYHDALSSQVVDCNQKYQMCPLTKADVKPMSLLNGLF